MTVFITEELSLQNYREGANERETGGDFTRSQMDNVKGQDC